jgi:hypothetical protein
MAFVPLTIESRIAGTYFYFHIRGYWRQADDQQVEQIGSRDARS